MLLFSWQYLGLYLGAHLPLSYRLWQAGWVPYPTLSLATYKYWVGGFRSLGESATTPIIHWASATAQGFLSPFIISGCVRQPPKFVHWGLCPLTAPLSGCALGFVSANRPIYLAGCVR